MVKNKKTLLVIFLLMVFASHLFADSKEIDSEDIQKTFRVILDASTAIVAVVSDNREKELPGCSFSISTESGLPVKATFLLADLYDIVLSLKPEGHDDFHSFWAGLFSNKDKYIDNTLLAAEFLQLSSKKYTKGQYVLSGFINIIYPENFTGMCLLENGVDQCLSGPVNIEIKMKILGTGLKQPVDLYGKFRLNSSSEGGFDISPSETYTINGYSYTGGYIHLQSY